MQNFIQNSWFTVCINPCYAVSAHETTDLLHMHACVAAYSCSSCVCRTKNCLYFVDLCALRARVKMAHLLYDKWWVRVLLSGKQLLCCSPFDCYSLQIVHLRSSVLLLNTSAWCAMLHTLLSLQLGLIHWRLVYMIMIHTQVIFLWAYTWFTVHINFEQCAV